VNADSDIAFVVSTLLVLNTLVCSTTVVLVAKIVEGAAVGTNVLDITDVTTTT
jgi:hypothetical protein